MVTIIQRIYRRIINLEELEDFLLKTNFSKNVNSYYFEKLTMQEQVSAFGLFCVAHTLIGTQ